jgi:hypothetical protein
MNYRRVTGLFGGAAAGALAVGAEVARAQSNAGGTISIGGSTEGLSESISSTVANAVSGIATGGGSASGGTTIERTEASFGEQEGLAIADASGGNNNVSFVS